MENQKSVENYLEENPEFLHEYVVDKISAEQLEKLLIRNIQKTRNRKLSLSRYKFCVHADKRKMLYSLTNSLYDMPNKVYVLHELSSTISSAINVNQWNLFLYDPITDGLKSIENICNLTNSSHEFANEDIENTLALYASKVKKAVSHHLDQYDCRFSNGVPLAPNNTLYALALPIVEPDNTLIGVLELYRKKGSLPFHEEDEEIANSYLVWGGVAIHYAELYIKLSQSRKLNTFLLSVVKSIFENMRDMDSVITKILEFARKLTNADRTSLFLVDHANQQLYAHSFDVNDTKKETVLKKEIRFAIGSGIAGYVAKTGETLNIANCYEDERFNRSIDQITGYHTKSLLCMPIYIREKIIGVLQMVNKKNGVFTKEDQDSFSVFATYCGLALDHSKLYQKIQKSEQKYKVAIEVLSYHNTCTDEELNKIKELPISSLPDETMPSFSPYKLSYDEKVLSFAKIFGDHFNDVTKLDMEQIYKFCLTVRKNYRRVPYHNWTHGFSVAHTVWIFTRNSEHFARLEKLAFFVSALCHDLDHRGTTNQFLVNSSASLAAIYTSSTLEHHHFNQTISILQQNGLNIFKHLSSQEYKQILALIKHNILATDLVQYFKNKAKLCAIFDTDSFDWTNTEHKNILSAVAMNGADLNSTALPWKETEAKTKELFEEFYAQGDIEIEQGRTPLLLMDRRKSDEQPKSQVDFISNISLPCLQLINRLLPDAKQYLENCKENLQQWKEVMKNEEKRLKLKNMTINGNSNTSQPLICSKITGKSVVERSKSFRL